MKQERYNVALIGCGDIAETGHLPALKVHPRFNLRALCDTSEARRTLLSSQASGVPAVENYRELLADKNIDAVILALHPEVSVNVAIDCLRAGKAVLDEKPLARTLEDGNRLARQIQESNAVYQIGFVFRYAPFILKAAEAARRIGTPAMYSFLIYDERLDRSNREHFNRIQHALRTSSAITHEGSHVMDYFQLLNPCPFVKANASAFRTDEDFAGNNLWSAQLSCADGSILSVEIGWLLPDLPPCELRIAGPRGRLRVDMRTGRGEISLMGACEPFEAPPLVQNWQRQLDVFASAIDAGKAQEATIEDGLRALRATVACETSARSGQAQTLI
ncbi:MAG TPA: Gfo/Idh/MocA family oxidoreductase [Planctomycetota bacterium]|nr:Gfo/Idh/MocA family oxidoreductase [Planctomycetota bacterium]